MQTLYSKTLIVTNKRSFLEEALCPKCSKKTEQKEVKIENDVFFFFSNIDYCPDCAKYYVSREQLLALNISAQQKFPKSPCPFISPSNARLEYLGDDVFILPLDLLNKDRYTRWKCPPQVSEFYIPSKEEYQRVIMQYQPENPYHGKANSESVLRREGYRYYLPREARREIIDRCIEKVGKQKVNKTLQYLITTRRNQEDGETRHKEKITIWSEDLEYVFRKL